MTPRATLLGSVAGICLFFVVFHTVVVSPSGFFSGDQSAKYLQSRAFATGGPLYVNIDVASRDIDPEYRYQEPVLRNRGGRLVATFSWLLPMLTAPFLKVLGTRGIYVIPMLSAIAIFLAAVALGRRLGVGDGLWTGWVVVLASPVLIYGAELWEHAPATACVMAAALLLAPGERPDRWRFVAAGSCLAAGALFREEAFLALPAFVLARAVSVGDHRVRDAVRAGALALAGAVLVFVATIPMNLAVYGSKLPLHLTSEIEKTGSYFDVRQEVLSTLLLPGSFVPAYAIAVGAALLSVVARIRRSRRAAAEPQAMDGALIVLMVCAAALVGIGILVPFWRLTVGGLSTFWSYRVDSIAHTWLFCVALAFLPWLGRDDIRRDVARFIGVGAVLLILGTLAIIPSPGGAQWSPRYLFVAAPLLAILASAPAWHASSSPAIALVRWSARAALACAVIAQACGLYYFVDAKARNARITEHLAYLASPQEVVITDVPWFPQVTATLLPAYRIVFAHSPAQVEEIAEAAAAHGHASIAFVSCTPETGYTPPHNIFATKAGCRYERAARLPLGERVLIFDRYNCHRP